jgi:ADP-heptose:LPS heptosyltransferase
MIARTDSPKILIIRLDGLGDTLLTLPLVAGLKQCWPECKITYLASPRGAAVFDDDSRITELWVHELTSLSWAEKWNMGQTIRAGDFDLVFCLNEKFWPSLWARMSGAPVRLGFDPGWSQPPKALLRRLTLTDWLQNPNDPSLPSIHEVERYAALAAIAGCEAATGPLNLMLPADAKNWAADQLATLGCSPDSLPVCLHLSAKWCSEKWSEQTCTEVALAILERVPSVFLIVTAGPGEEQFFASADALLPAKRFQLFQNLTLAEWAALLAQSRGLVSMDTGAVHLAAAVNVPVVAVFPELNFSHASSRWAPWKVPHRMIRRPAPEDKAKFLSQICTALEAIL